MRRPKDLSIEELAFMIDMLEHLAPPVAVESPAALATEEARYKLAFEAGKRQLVTELINLRSFKSKKHSL